MKKKILGILLMGVLVLSLTGCGIKYPDLEKDAIGFQTGNYIDKNDNSYLNQIEVNNEIIYF